MTGKLIDKITDWWEDSLHSFFGRLNPDRRVILIVIMLISFSGLSVFMTFSSIYDLGKERGEKMQMEHISRLQFELKRLRPKTDSLKLQKILQYDRE
jgi:hypothetical protein